MSSNPTTAPKCQLPDCVNLPCPNPECPNVRKEEFGWDRGAGSFVILAVLVGIAILLLTVAVLGLLGVADDASYFGTVGAVGVLIAGVGAATRALAHNRKSRATSDHIGKLLTVTALSSTFVGAIGALTNPLPFLWAFLLLAVAVLIVILGYKIAGLLR